MEMTQEQFHVRRILVVDDEEEYREMIRQYLQKLGYTCQAAPGASEAVKILRSSDFDLVVSDIRMPGKNGIEFMKEVSVEYPQLDFIIMTGHFQEYSYSDIIAAGATDFISKPFEMGKLRSKLERIEREKRLVRQLKEANDLLRSANTSLAWEAAANSSFASLAESLLGSSSLTDMSNLALQCATELTESQDGFAGYIDQKSGRLVPLAIAGEVWKCSGAPDAAPAFKDCCGLSGLALQNLEALMINNPQNDPSSQQSPEEHTSIQRLLSAPAAIGETHLGQIAVANARRDYGSKDLTLLRRLATIYALAVQRWWMDNELQQVRDYLENVFENAAEAIGIVDEHGRFTKWNRAAEEVCGYSFEELKGKAFHELYPDKEALENMLSQLRRDGFVNGYEIAWKKKDDKIAPLRISICLLKNDKGKVIGSVAVAMDMSDLKDSLSKLELANRQLQSEIVERERISQELREARDQLEKLVLERTEKLSKAGELLKRSIHRFKEITEE